MSMSHSQKSFALTSRRLHNDVRMLVMGTHQDLRDVIPCFQLFARDILCCCDRVEQIKVCHEVDGDLPKYEIVTAKPFHYNLTHLPEVGLASRALTTCLVSLIAFFKVPTVSEFAMLTGNTRSKDPTIELDVTS